MSNIHTLNDYRIHDDTPVEGSSDEVIFAWAERMAEKSGGPSAQFQEQVDFLLGRTLRSADAIEASITRAEKLCPLRVVR
jgi:hypothetical protein